jgi:acid phosphatase
MSRCRWLFVSLLSLTLIQLASAKNPNNLAAPSPENAGLSQGNNNPGLPARSNHVVVVMEENRSINYALEYMPYLASLASQYSQGMQVYSDSHGSWLAYGELTSGLQPSGGQADHGICNGDGCTQPINIPNLVRQLGIQGKTWKGYFQTMPAIGFMGYQFNLYVRRHNPFAFYTDVVFNIPEQWNMFPLDTYLLQDIQNNRLPNFAWISPDLDHDAHDGTDDQDALTAADEYLQTFLPQLLASPPFQHGGNGVLLVTFDEGELSGDNHCGGDHDANNCGGHIWQVLIGPQVKRGYQSNTHYMQGSQLRMFCDLLGLNACPGDGATSPNMNEFFVSGTIGAP